MRIARSATYERMFAALTKQDRESVAKTLELFKDDPENASLKNHLLRKPFAWLRSIWADNDLRIILKERNQYDEVVLLRVWNHDKVYGTSQN